METVMSGARTHTPESWETDITADGEVELLLHHEGRVICVFPKVEGVAQGAEQDANIERILACVNGCAGLNPAAYRACVEALKHIAEHYRLGRLLPLDAVSPQEQPKDAIQKAISALAQATQP